MKYAVDEINANQILLPGIKLGYEIYDTCRQSAVIVKPAISFLTAKSDNVLSVECNYTDYETSISAVIGPYSSEMVSVIGKLMGFFLMPQVWLKLCLFICSHTSSFLSWFDRFVQKYSYLKFKLNIKHLYSSRIR